MIAAFLGAAPALVEAEPYGFPVRVSTTTTNYMRPCLSKTGDGDFAVLWNSGTAGSPNGHMVRYNVRGQRLDGSSPYNLGAGQWCTSGGQGRLLLFQVTSDGVFARVETPTGGGVVSRVRVSTSSTGPVLGAAGAISSSGHFVVAWSTAGGVPNSGIARQLWMRRFDATGGALSSPILVQSHTNTNEELWGMDVGIDNAGNSVVSWSFGNVNTTAGPDVWVRRYGPSGSPLSAALRANTNTNGWQEHPRLAVHSDGSFMVIWVSGGVFGRRFSSAGLPLGAEIQIADEIYFAGVADVSMDPSGRVSVAWSPSLETIMVRSYDAAGAPLGSATQVNTGTRWNSGSVSIQADSEGNFDIAWLEEVNYLDRIYDPMVRRYSPPGTGHQTISNGATLTALQGATDSWRYYRLSVPSSHTTVDMSIFGGAGDADLYVRWGVFPTLEDWDGRPALDGNNEGVRMLSFPPGIWYIGVHGFADYSGLSLSASSF